MDGMKCSRADLQYFLGVCLKINVKLGGINAVLGSESSRILADRHNQTMIMGVDRTLFRSLCIQILIVFITRRQMSHGR